VHAINGFVASHSAPSTRINQLGRWREPVCPVVTGLQTPSRDLVTREILDVARRVGAPIVSGSKACSTTVEIVFAKEPQALRRRIRCRWALIRYRRPSR
jgi:hypothetical protein